MPVDPGKPRMVLVVHGVQTGTSDDQKQHQQIKQLIDQRGGHLGLQYDTSLYRYEDKNDQVIDAAKNLMNLLGTTPIGKAISKSVLDLVGDVVISLHNGKTAQAIREGLKHAILTQYQNATPCYLVAHSLGSIYAFDVVNELIADPAYFDRSDRTTWPVQGFATIGSPIGLDMFRKDRPAIQNLGAGTSLFRWVNYWDRTDPVVSGDIFGSKLNGNKIAELYANNTLDQGWAIRDIPMDTGLRWLISHTAYWKDAKFGDGLVDLIAH